MDKCKSTWHCPLSHCITEPSYIGWYSQSLYPPRCWLSYWSGVFVLAVRTIRCNVPKLALVGYGWHYSTPQNGCFHTKKQPLWALIPQWPNLYGVVTDQNVSICFSVGDSLNIVKPSVGKGRENLLRVSPPKPSLAARHVFISVLGAGRRAAAARRESKRRFPTSSTCAVKSLEFGVSRGSSVVLKLCSTGSWMVQ